MNKLGERIARVAVGASLATLFEFVLVESVLGGGIVYDLANGGYVSDFMKTGNPSELLDFNELNVAEMFGSVAIVVSLALLLFNLSRRSKGSNREVAA